MDPNVLLSEAPSTVIVGGASVSIDTHWRTSVRVLRDMDDPTIDRDDKVRHLLAAYYAVGAKGGKRIPRAVLANAKEAVDKAAAFLNLNEPKKPRSLQRGASKGVRTFDWDHDARLVIADFQREYGLDLTDPALEMHWWRWWSLFRGLSDTSRTIRAISIRGARPTKGMTKAEKGRLEEMQRELLLPARTEEEARRLTEFVWSVDV